ncbi:MULTISPECIES: hypothetical protein [unclassified Pseudoalteromonas]|uniref:hypothetical protein n=1 Tax=unclassified Pseudoalteromonas TaxID=194690 RepID=UPI0025B53C4C|nr:MULTISPECIES: hypothetical protein [unclassified Pseudoalteromonas]MDN3380478.1 hypothetical protein [Pseudoalteromonas sp. APC 3893]MDN3388860.1 hypothetical protein [Pseudoalteromonas sp. APC 4017]
MTKATKIQVQDTILDSIQDSLEKAHQLTGVTYRQMPEYFLNVSIVNALCDKFPNLGYRLEIPVREVLGTFGLIETSNDQDLRIGGKFDIAIISRKSKRIRHVIEVKRSISQKELLKEAKRIYTLADAEHGSKRLQTGYIVSVRRLKETLKSTKASDLIDKRLDYLSTQLEGKAKVSVRYSLLEDVQPYGFDEHEKLLISVFSISV